MSPFEPPSLPPAGWYDDPEHPGRPRYWDGRTWDAPEPPGSGFGGTQTDALPDIGEWLTRAFRRMRQRWLSLAIVATLTTAPSTVVFLVASRILTRDLQVVDNDLVGWSDDRIAPMVAAFIFAIILFGAGTMAMSCLMLRSFDEDPFANQGADSSTGATPEFQRAMQSIWAGLRTLPRAIGWFIVVTAAFGLAVLVLAIATAAVPPLGILLIVVFIPIVVFVIIRLAFMTQAIADSPGAPFRRSADVSHGRFWATVWRLLLLGLITWAISTAVNLASSLFGGQQIGADGSFTFDENGFTDTVDIAELFDFSSLAIATSGVVAIVTGVLVSGLSSAAATELYRTRNPRD